MLLVEQLLSGHSHTHHEHIILPSTESSPRTQKSLPLGGATDVMFDVELGGLEHPEGIVPEFIPIPRSSSSSQVNQIHDALGRSDDTKKRAYPLTLGLVIHALADGLALGSSALANNSAIPSGLSLVVFLALIVHKGEFPNIPSHSE